MRLTELWLVQPSIDGDRLQKVTATLWPDAEREAMVEILHRSMDHAMLDDAGYVHKHRYRFEVEVDYMMEPTLPHLAVPIFDGPRSGEVIHQADQNVLVEMKVPTSGGGVHRYTLVNMGPGYAYLYQGEEWDMASLYQMPIEVTIEEKAR